MNVPILLSLEKVTILAQSWDNQRISLENETSSHQNLHKGEQYRPGYYCIIYQKKLLFSNGVAWFS